MPGGVMKYGSIGVRWRVRGCLLGVIACCGSAVAASVSDTANGSLIAGNAGFDTHFQISLPTPRIVTGSWNADNSKSTGGTWISNGELALDWNGDGLTDYLDGGSVYPAQATASAYQAIKLKLYINQGNGTFVDQADQLIRPAAPARYHFSECVSDDFNRDGRPDLYCVGGGADIPPYGGETGVYLLSAPDGKWDDRSDLLPQKTAFGHYAAVGRINGDGIPHIFVHNICGGSETASYFLLNDGKGGLTQDKSRVPSILSNCIGQISSKFADLDGDGFDDLVLGSGHANAPDKAYSRVVFNDGKGSFTGTPLNLPAGCFGDDNTIVPELIVGDATGDGRPDILLSATRLSPFYKDGCIQLLVNQGQRRFADETASRITGQPGAWVTKIDLIDVNNDGYPDLVPALSGSLFWGNGCPNAGCESLAQVWLNDGAGRFAPLSFPLPRVVGTDQLATPRATTGPFAIRLKAGEPVSLWLTYTGVGNDLSYFRQNLLYQATQPLPAAFAPAATASGSSSALSLSVRLPVSSNRVGQPGAAFVVAGKGSQWFAYDGKSWQPWSSVPPAAWQGTLPAMLDFTLLQGLDVRGLSGFSVLGGYGSDLSEMLNSGRYRTLYSF